MSLEEMKIITEQDGIYIARAMGYVSVEELNEYVPSPREFQKPRIQRKIEFEDNFAIITRWDKEERGWDLCQNGILHQERVNQRKKYAYVTLDVIQASLKGVEGILGQLMDCLKFHYRAYEAELVEKNKRDMKHSLRDISGTIEKMIREELFESEYERKDEQFKRN